MSVVKIILILGLIYVAMNEKVEKTRNMLLVVTGLLAFCMFSVEGFQILDPGTCTETAPTTGGSSVATDAAACGAVTALNDSTACEAVMTAADSSVGACTYTAGIARDVQNNDIDDLFPGCIEGKKIKDPIPPTGDICENIPASGAPAPSPEPEDDSWCPIM